MMEQMDSEEKMEAVITNHEDYQKKELELETCEFQL